MTITFAQAGTVSTATASPHVVNFPSGIANTDSLLYLGTGSKPSSRSPGTVAGFTDHLTSNNGGTGSTAVDTGPVRADAMTGNWDGSTTSASITWSAAPSPGMLVVCEFRKTIAGAWSVVGIDAADATISDGFSATALTTIDITAGDMIVVNIMSATDTGTRSAPVITVPGCTVGAATLVIDSQTGTGNDGWLGVAYATVTAGTATGGVTFTMTATGGNGHEQAGSIGIVRLREPAGTSPPVGTATGTTTWTGSAVGVAPALGTPSLSRRMVGTTGLIRTKTTSTTSARLKIGTDSAVTTGLVYSSAVAPDASGYATHDTTGLGLTAGGTYYYRVEMTGSGAPVLDNSGVVGKFRVAPTGATSFSFSFGSCTDFTLLTGGATDSAALAAVAAHDDDLFIHLGDLYYADGSGDDAANFRAQMASRLDAPNHAAIFATRASTYTPSDHDAGMVNDGNGTEDPTALANFNTVYREMWPAPVPGTSGVYYTFTWGRVRFIQLDGRTFKSNNGVTDNSAKTVLGATQKQWLKDTIDAATEAVIVIAQDIPWVGAAEASDDSWLGYTTERAELGAHFAASGKSIVLLAGDMHAAAFDDGSNSVGGVPVLHGAPFLAPRSVKGGPYATGPLPASGGTLQQYGRVVVTDNGASVAMTFTARSSSGTTLLTETMEFGPRAGTATGSVAWTGTAIGRRSPVATASGTTGWTGTATGKRRPIAVASGSLVWTGAATGIAPGDVVLTPTPPGRILTVPAESRTVLVAAESRTVEVTP